MLKGKKDGVDSVISFSTPYMHNCSKSKLLYFSFNSLMAPTTLWADVVNEYPEKEELFSSIVLHNIEAPHMRLFFCILELVKKWNFIVKIDKCYS